MPISDRWGGTAQRLSAEGAIEAENNSERQLFGFSLSSI
jgi:hypothetical protein